MFISRIQYLNIDVSDERIPKNYLILIFVLGVLFLVRGLWVYIAARRAVRRMMTALPVTVV